MEIERKFLSSIPKNLSSYKKKEIEQVYLCTSPVIRARQEGDDHYLTYKGSGLLAREEYNLPLNKEAYLHLKEKADFSPVEKTRYFIPFEGYTIELDIFKGTLSPLVMAEIEFDSREESDAFNMERVPFFTKEVTFDSAYSNSSLSKNGLPESFLSPES